MEIHKLQILHSIIAFEESISKSIEIYPKVIYHTIALNFGIYNCDIMSREYRF